MWRISKQLGLKFPKGNKSPLTAEQLIKIEELAAQNITACQVSETLGITYKIVIGAYERLGLIPAGKKLQPLTSEQNSQVVALFNQGNGTRNIAKIMSVSRDAIKNAFKELDLDNAGRKVPRTVHLVTEKLCPICEVTQSIDNFRKRINKNNGRISYEC